jgi:hypothetical protein
VRERFAAYIWIGVQPWEALLRGLEAARCCDVEAARSCNKERQLAEVFH